ncbi:hypothetical protein KIH75_03660, partial [Bifidobacterium sp. 64T4]|uniref:hypothetical protein n=1 Tax=Bifidobacterium pongonis TaxID=2834432 RepID=UPI001C57D943
QSHQVFFGVARIASFGLFPMIGSIRLIHGTIHRVHCPVPEPPPAITPCGVVIVEDLRRP